MYVIKLKPHSIEDNCVQLLFTIQDTGVGIPAEKIKLLFNPFTQLDTSDARKYGGTGLGLAICNRLVTVMKGEIGVESIVGKGTSFWVKVDFDYPAEMQYLGDLQTVEKQKDLLTKSVTIITKNKLYGQLLETLMLKFGMRTSVFLDVSTLTEQMKKGIAYDYVILGSDTLGGHDEDILNLCSKYQQQEQTGYLAFCETGITTKQYKQKMLPCIQIPVNQVQVLQSLGKAMKNEGTYTEPITSIVEQKAILLVEDNEINQKLAKYVFKKLGYEIEIASGGFDAIQMIKDKHYDLVFMDIQMPEMDGVEATQIIKSNWLGKDCPKIIAMTANAMAGDSEKYLAAGLDDYLSKPVLMKDIKSMIEKWS